MTILELNEIFKVASKNVDYRIDEASKNQVEIFGKIWHEKYFPLGSRPRLQSEFKTILNKMHFTIAASTIDERASEPVRVKQGLSKIERSMLTHAHAFRHDHDEIRDLVVQTQLAIANKGADPDGYKQAIKDVENYLMNSIEDAVMGVKARLSIIILEALTNEGKFTFTQENDPGSPYVGETIDFRMPAENCGKVGSGNEWVAGNESKVDPVKEIAEVCLKHKRKKFTKIWVRQETVNFMLKTDSYKSYINNQLTSPNQPLTLERINAWNKANGYPEFEVVNFVAGVQTDYHVDDYEPFKEGMMVFVPETKNGVLGHIETLVPDSKLGMKSDGVSYKDYNRIEVRELRYGERENSNYTEITKGSLTGAPSIEEMANIVSLDTLH